MTRPTPIPHAPVDARAKRAPTRLTCHCLGPLARKLCPSLVVFIFSKLAHRSRGHLLAIAGGRGSLWGDVPPSGTPCMQGCMRSRIHGRVLHAHANPHELLHARCLNQWDTRLSQPVGQTASNPTCNPTCMRLGCLTWWDVLHPSLHALVANDLQLQHHSAPRLAPRSPRSPRVPCMARPHVTDNMGPHKRPVARPKPQARPEIPDHLAARLRPSPMRLNAHGPRGTPANPAQTQNVSPPKRLGAPRAALTCGQQKARQGLPCRA